MGTIRKWTDDKLNKLEKLAKEITCREAAEIFGVTEKSLMAAAYYHGISFKHPGKKKKNSKLSSDDVFLIRALGREGVPIREVAEKFEIEKSWANRIIKGIARKDG